jgi:hypothetical protein
LAGSRQVHAHSLARERVDQHQPLLSAFLDIAGEKLTTTSDDGGHRMLVSRLRQMSVERRDVCRLHAGSLARARGSSLTIRERLLHRAKKVNARKISEPHVQPTNTAASEVSMRNRSALLVCAVLALGATHCGDDGTYYGGSGPGDCSIGDPVEGPTCECSGDECVCPSSGDCAIYCIDSCGLQCAGSGSCEFDCIDGCDVSCTGAGNCDLEVGHDSTVSCTGSGDCDITCFGDCTIDCPGSGTCRARCADEYECNFFGCAEDGETCENGDVVCNGSC